jgi:hypothetical protein
MSNTTITPTVGAAAVAGNIAATVLAGILTAAWSGLAENASGAPIQSPGNVMQAKFTASGTFGAGGVVAIEGSPDGVNWTELGTISAANVPAVGAVANAAVKAGPPNAVPTGTATINSVSGVTVPSVPAVPNDSLIVSVTDGTSGAPIRYFQPVVQGGDGTTSLAVTAQVSSVGAI